MNKTLSELERETTPPVKSALEEHDPDHIVLDTEQVFLLYTTFLGDADQTAAALGVPGKYIAKLAESEKWDDRIRPILDKKKSKKPGDVERAINRALCFVQAHQYRNFLERVRRRIAGWSDGQLDDYLIKWEPKKGKIPEGQEQEVKPVLQTRALADLAVAMQKAHEMCYMALNDTTPERSKRKEVEGEADMSLSAIHAQLARGMAQAEPATGAGQLAVAQIEMAQAEAVEAVRVKDEPPIPPALVNRYDQD